MEYDKRAGYLQEQEQLQNNDIIDRRAIPHTIVYDKRYHAKYAVFQKGNQSALQLVWAESDQKFSHDDTLLTAVVANDCGANER